jgi:hypothetical protein
MRVVADCRSLDLASPKAIYLKPNGVSEINAHGFVGEVDRAATVKVKNTNTGQVIPFDQHSFAIEEAKLGGVPTVAVLLKDTLGPFVVNLQNKATIAALRTQSTQTAISVTGIDLSLMFEADAL